MQQKITPHLWFDTQAREAAGFYCSVFPDSRIDSVVRLRDTPSGDCDVVSFVLHGQPFMAISAGPLFKFNPSVSFMVNFDPSRQPDARERLDATWANLMAEGGRRYVQLVGGTRKTEVPGGRLEGAQRVEGRQQLMHRSISLSQS